MQTNLLWTGREYYSLENCLVKSSSAGTEITSTILGLYKKKIYKVEYRIKTDPHWNTLLLELGCLHNNKTQVIRLESNGRGSWKKNGKKAPAFEGCKDVDIPLTPFTNTLPIRRLRLKQKETQQIRVIYCDLLEAQLRPVSQKYTCLSATRYHYENVPNDFEATIKVDKQGLVIDYPELFVRTAALDAHYK